MKSLNRTPWLPAFVPADPAQGVRAITADLQILKRALESYSSYLLLETLHEAPLHPEDGMVVKADGTNWDPGSGAGYYTWEAASGTWEPFSSGSGGGASRAYAARHG